MRRADIEVPNRFVDVDSWKRSACYPRSTFYPLSDGPSTRDHRITMTVFRLCLTCQSRSQAGLCLCTRQLISDQLEPTFARLRYFLGGDRPSQTTHQALSGTPIRGTVRTKIQRGWYSTVGSTRANARASKPPSYPLHAKPQSNAKM